LSAPAIMSFDAPVQARCRMPSASKQTGPSSTVKGEMAEMRFTVQRLFTR
jgi:hypothetical protein